MHDMNLEKNRSKIQTAYKVSPFTKGTCPEPEDAVKRFESRYTPIPAEYRWLLLNFGGCYLAEPWIFTLKELEEAYPIFQEAYEDYMSEYDHGPTFPIGGLGDGSIVFIDLESGRVRGYNCDYADLEEIAENFPACSWALWNRHWNWETCAKNCEVSVWQRTSGSACWSR